MKKRLLSAALALAMALTLLPVSAFAVEYAVDTTEPNNVLYTDSKGDSHRFYEVSADGKRVSTVTVKRADKSDAEKGLVEGHWYWLDNKNNKDTHTYYEATTGLVAGTSGSGLWYPNVNAYTKETTNSDGSTTSKVSGAFTILDDTALRDLSSYKDSSLTICLNGQTAGLVVPSVITQLRLTNAGTGWAPMSDKGTVANISIDRGDFGGDSDGTKTGLTITADGIVFGSIVMTGRANTLNLTNCAVGAITMDGTTEADKDGAKHNYNAQKVTMTGGSLTGEIRLTGDNSSVTLTSVTGNKDITVVSNGGSINVSGASVVKDIVSTARTKTGNYPSVTVSGGTADSITRTPNAGAESDNGITITVSGGNTTVGNIGESSIPAGHPGRNTIKVTSATVGEIKTTAGTLTIDGSSTKTGLITLGDTTDTSGLSLSVGSSSTGLNIGGITSTSTRLKISSWPTDRDNRFGTVNLNDYGGHGINGGTFTGDNGYGNEQSQGWFNKNLQFRVRTADGQPWKMYRGDELGQALSDLGTTAANVANNIVVLGQPGGSAYLDVMNGDTHWGRVYFATDSSIILPGEVNSVKINSWIGPNGEPAYPGKSQAIIHPGAGNHVTINATETAANVTKILNVAVNNSTIVENQNIRVSFKENTATIGLSGAIKVGTGGLAVIRLDLTTDVIGTDGKPVVLEGVPVVYDTNNGNSLKFDNWTAVGNNKYGASVVDGALKLANGTVYTVTNSTLQVSASNLGLWKDGIGGTSPIVVTFGGTLSSWKQEQKDELAAKLSGADCGFTIGTNKAVAEAINAAQATITSETSVDSLVQKAQSYVWTNGNRYLDSKGQPNGLGKGSASFGTGDNEYLTKHTGNISKPGEFDDDAADILGAYSKAYIVPYLVINVTDYNQNGAMTATLTPYYRVDVSSKDGYNAAEYYTVQTGRAMSALTGNMIVGCDPVKVTFKLPSAFTVNSYMHQDGQYVYKPSKAGDVLTWSISHAGANGSLGTMVINDKAGPIRLDDAASDKIDPRTPALSHLATTYDTLQAAVDDTVPGTTNKSVVTTCDTIVVGSAYKGSCAVNMTGLARTIRLKFEGNHDVVTGQGSTDVKGSDGFNYTVQLTKDVASSKKGNITINSATGGSASVNNSNAKAGDTVTITLTPSSGYTSNGVTVTSGGQNISVSGSGNSYSFTMPSGSVTITPKFKSGTPATGTTASVTVSSPSGGSATTSAGSDKVSAGDTVTVTVQPNSGQRTMGLYVNGSDSSAVRTGDNSFRFTVPSGTTNVVVTPRFDVDNGTKFTDVWSTDYYSRPVAWAVSKGITNGTSTYTFGSTNGCTREDMVTFLYRAAGSPPVGNVANPFWDVQPGSYYYNAVLWAVSKGITNGVSANQFGVGQWVTRGQAVTFLYRYENSPAASGNGGFYDVNSRDYYAKAVSWASSKGVTNGTTATTFSPNDYCQRCQIVTFMYRDMTGNAA